LIAGAILLVAAFIAWLFEDSLKDFLKHHLKKLRWPGRLPKAEPNVFTVAVAHLDNDSDGQGERLIVEALGEIKGIQWRQFDRTLPAGGSGQVNPGHEIARKYLKDSGAEVLIWGTLLKAGDKFVPKLCLTSSRVAKESARYQLTEDLNLPPLFHSDLVNLLRLLVANYAAEFSAQEGQFIAGQLGPFIAKVRQLLAASQAQEGWNADARAELRFIFANASATFGQQSGNNQSLGEAVAAYREALKEYTRERVPLDWAMTQNNLGAALRTLGARESGTARLEEAVAAYREALKEYTRERVPLYWATTRNNLGNALRILGERKRNMELISEALESHIACWEISSPAAPHYASIAAENAKRDVDSLRSGFEPSSYQGFLAKHEQVLKQMGVLN
jgi:tetratricopeptide (TPR) repeat protein